MSTRSRQIAPPAGSDRRPFELLELGTTIIKTHGEIIFGHIIFAQEKEGGGEGDILGVDVIRLEMQISDVTHLDMRWAWSLCGRSS